MKQEDVFKIRIELELLKEGFYDSYINEYLSVSQNYRKLEDDFEHLIYERTDKGNKRATGYKISQEVLRKWWYLQKRPELFDKKLISKFE